MESLPGSGRFPDGRIWNTVVLRGSISRRVGGVCSSVKLRSEMLGSDGVIVRVYLRAELMTVRASAQRKAWSATVRKGSPTRHPGRENALIGTATIDRGFLTRVILISETVIPGNAIRQGLSQNSGCRMVTTSCRPSPNLHRILA